MKRVKGMSGDQMADVLGQWNATEELSSYLVEITEVCLRTKDPETGADLVEAIMDQAGQKGTGLWTVVTALQMGASVPTIYASLNGRVMSSMKQQRVAAEPLLRGPAVQDFDLGQPDDAMAPLMDAVVLSCIASYAQGMELLRIASNDLDYGLHMPSIASDLERRLHHSLALAQTHSGCVQRRPQLVNLMIDPWFADQVNRRLPGWPRSFQEQLRRAFQFPASAAHWITSTAIAPRVCRKTWSRRCVTASDPIPISVLIRRAPSTPNGWTDLNHDWIPH